MNSALCGVKMKILQASGDENVWQLQKEGFKAFSAGEVMIPKVTCLPFNGQGDLHLKGAHKKGGDIYVILVPMWPVAKDTDSVQYVSVHEHVGGHSV